MAACWGETYAGQGKVPKVPLTEITAGTQYACGLAGDGSVHCWGYDNWGQASPPSGVFNQVTAGADFACGLQASVPRAVGVTGSGVRPAHLPISSPRSAPAGTSPVGSPPRDRPSAGEIRKTEALQHLQPIASPAWHRAGFHVALTHQARSCAGHLEGAPALCAPRLVRPDQCRYQPRRE